MYFSSQMDGYEFMMWKVFDMESFWILIGKVLVRVGDTTTRQSAVEWSGLLMDLGPTDSVKVLMDNSVPDSIQHATTMLSWWARNIVVAELLTGKMLFLLSNHKH